MTKEEAREVLKEQIDRYGQEYDEEGIEALEMAIKALEQQPCKDWLSTFNTESATACYTAVQRLKESVDEIQ